MNKRELDFLRESNNIEQEWDDESLADAILAWEYLKGEKKLSAKVILETHRLLMVSRGSIEAEDKGRFRDGPVWIGGHEAKPWFAILTLLSQWLVNANDLVINGQNENEDLLERLVREHHVSFESIHPFFDGNGRLGRLLWQWERIQMGLPVLVIKENEKDKYYKWF